MTSAEHETIERMERFGGSFVKALANAARFADRKNLDIIKTSWPEYWETYGPDGPFSKEQL